MASPGEGLLEQWEGIHCHKVSHYRLITKCLQSVVISFDSVLGGKRQRVTSRVGSDRQRGWSRLPAVTSEEWKDA